MITENLKTITDKPYKISEVVSEIPEALSIAVNQIVYDLRRKGNDVIALSLGEAFFDIPLFDFRKLDFDKSYHYSDSQGIPGLRNKIAKYYEDYYKAPVDASSELIITAGSKIGIFMAMRAVLDAGDEVLIHEPAWLSYQEQARLVGAIPSFIPFNIPIENFSRYFKPDTRLLIINNPNNPAGRVYTRAELTSLLQVCRSRGVYMLIDEAYSDFVIGDEFVSGAQLAPDKNGIIIVNSLSKNMGMSGWRVGYLITHNLLIKSILKVNQHIMTCAPSILLYYLEKYFEQIIEVTLPQVRAVVEKRERVRIEMDRVGLRYLPGASTFYFFVSIDDFPGTSLEFALALLVNHGIAVVPGNAYGESTGRFIRISIGTETEERVFGALAVIRSMVALDNFDMQPTLEHMKRLGIIAPRV
jgi:aspartate/methionine/tyrosine aminotransferase